MLRTLYFFWLKSISSKDMQTIGDKMDSNFSLVLVIIAAYNAKVFIGRTLKSVRSQTYKNLEKLLSVSYSFY